ncbi:MAG: GLPGLI family protein, partial [Xylanibacter rarus]
MRRIISISLLAVSAMLGSAQTNINVFTPEDLQPGKPCDTLRYVITYDMAYVEDTLQVPMKAAHETMLLETGRKVTAFYSYDAFRSDSINAELLSRGATQYSVLGRIPWRLYANYPETGRSSFTEKLGLDRFVCVESVEKPQWQLCPDSSATILGYPCRLAIANYKGRLWSAWYAE